MTTTTTKESTMESATENPITAALAILKKDGWAKGAYLCTGDGDGQGKPGSHCALGAVRAAMGIHPNDVDQVVLSVERVPRLAGRGFDFVVTKSKPTSKGLLKRYRKAVVALVDAIEPEWAERIYEESYEMPAEGSDYSTVTANWVREMRERDGIHSLKDVRKKASLSTLEGIVISYNDDNLAFNDAGRKRIIRRFEKAAKALESA